MGAAAAILEQRGRQRRVDGRGRWILAIRSHREKRLLETESFSARDTPDGRTVWALAHGVLAVQCAHVNVCPPLKERAEGN